MSDPTEELMELSMETRQLSAYIGKLKDDRTMVTDEAKIERLSEEIKMRQYRAFVGQVVVNTFTERKVLVTIPLR